MSEEYLKIRKRALMFLAKREHGVHELRVKLRAKNDNESAIDDVLHTLKQENYLSDERYAGMMFRHRFSRGNGPKRVVYELQQKKVSETTIQKSLNAFEGDWFQLAQETRQKRFGEWQDGNYKEKAKQMKFLAARGFEMSHIEGAFEVEL